jgi:hypothetical protein
LQASLIREQAKLAQDQAGYVRLMINVEKRCRGLHSFRVFHLKSENIKGGNIVETFMSARVQTKLIEDGKFDSVRDTVLPAHVKAIVSRIAVLEKHTSETTWGITAMGTSTRMGVAQGANVY